MMTCAHAPTYSTPDLLPLLQEQACSAACSAAAAAISTSIVQRLFIAQASCIEVSPAVVAAFYH